MPQPISADQNITFTGDIRFNNDELKIEEQLNFGNFRYNSSEDIFEGMHQMQMLMVLKLDL